MAQEAFLNVEGSAVCWWCKLTPSPSTEISNCLHPLLSVENETSLLKKGNRYEKAGKRKAASLQPALQLSYEGCTQGLKLLQFGEELDSCFTAHPGQQCVQQACKALPGCFKATKRAGSDMMV